MNPIKVYDNATMAQQHDRANGVNGVNGVKGVGVGHATPSPAPRFAHPSHPAFCYVPPGSGNSCPGNTMT